MPMMQTLISQGGPLPATVKFKARGQGDFFFYLAGSAWSSLSGTLMSIELALDGTPVGVATVYNNESSSHKAFVPVFIPVTLDSINHQITLSVTSANTFTDANDFFQVMLIY